MSEGLAPQPEMPRTGDTLVTLTCDGTLPLEERIELLAYAFAKVVQGSILRTVIKWDISHGCIKFVLSHVAVTKAPRGSVKVQLEEAPEVEVTTEMFIEGR